MSRLAGPVVRVFWMLTWTDATAVTFTGGVVVVRGVAPGLPPPAVLVATGPLGVEPLGKWTVISRLPLLPAGSGGIITNWTRVGPEPIEFGVTLTAAASVVVAVETNWTSAGSRSSTSAFRQGPEVLLQ